MFTPASEKFRNMLCFLSLILKTNGKQRQKKKKTNLTNEQREGVMQCLFKNFKNNKPQCAYIKNIQEN